MTDDYGLTGLDPGTAALFVLVLLLGLNQVVLRIEAWTTRGVLATLALLNAVVGGAVLAFGLPGYESVPAVRFVVGLLLCFHAADMVRRQRLLVHQRHADSDHARRMAELSAKLTDDRD